MDITYLFIVCMLGGGGGGGGGVTIIHKHHEKCKSAYHNLNTELFYEVLEHWIGHLP